MKDRFPVSDEQKVLEPENWRNWYPMSDGRNLPNIKRTVKHNKVLDWDDLFGNVKNNKT